MKWYLFFTIFVNALFLHSANAQVINNLDLELIQENIDRLGAASVIVEFESLAVTNQALESLQGENLRSAIDSRRASFMALASQNLADSIQQSYDYVPGFVAVVGDSELDELQQHPMVKGIFKNKLNQTSLAESVDLVYPRKRSAGFDGGDGWTVAVLDTGVDRSHEVFRKNGINRVASEACYSGGNLTRFSEIDSLCPGNATRSTSVGSGVHCTGYSGCDHGTHVAGIAAGNDGVASGANIIAIQVFTGIRDLFFRNICGTGPGQNCIGAFDSDILAGLNRVYALRNSMNIAAVNMSLGGGKFSGNCNSDNTLITNIISQLRGQGILTTISSGNNGFANSISAPACISAAIAVGATADEDDAFFGYVKDKRAFYSNSSELLDVYAPGSQILSSEPSNQYGVKNGTSMAAPHVAGALAIFRQASPNASVAQLEQLLATEGPTVTVAGVVRRRLSIYDSLSTMGVLGGPPMTPIYDLLLED